MVDNSKEYLLECEARYWIKEVRHRGHTWWNQRKESIRRKRGDHGLQILLNKMNEIRTSQK